MDDFCFELDGGKAWRRRLPEALEGGYEHGVEGSGIEAFLEVRKRKKGLARGCLTKLFCRDPKATLESLGGQLLDDFRSRIRWWKGVAKEIAGSLGGSVLDAADSGIEAFLEVRKRKKGLARGCFKNLFYGIRKRR